MKLKVYGWIGMRLECKTTHRQTREIVAASSMEEAARLAGYKRASQLFNLCETGNSTEIEVATAEPRVIFWSQMDRKDFVRATPPSGA